MKRHLMYAPRSRSTELLSQLTETMDRLCELVRRTDTGCITGTHMEIEIASLVSALVDIERYLQDPNMDWRTAP